MEAHKDLFFYLLWRLIYFLFKEMELDEQKWKLRVRVDIRQKADWDKVQGDDFY